VSAYGWRWTKRRYPAWLREARARRRAARRAQWRRRLLNWAADVAERVLGTVAYFWWRVSR